MHSNMIGDELGDRFGRDKRGSYYELGKPHVFLLGGTSTANADADDNDNTSTAEADTEGSK